LPLYEKLPEVESIEQAVDLFMKNHETSPMRSIQLKFFVKLCSESKSPYWKHCLAGIADLIPDFIKIYKSDILKNDTCRYLGSNPVGFLIYNTIEIMPITALLDVVTHKNLNARKACETLIKRAKENCEDRYFIGQQII